MSTAKGGKKGQVVAPEKAVKASGWTEADKAGWVEAVFAGMAEGRTLQEVVQGEAKARGVALTPGAVRNWIAANEAWFGRYQKAKVLLGQALAEEALQVARDSSTSTTAIDRVLIDTLKWKAAKANPAEYGERQTVEHQGAQTLQVKVVEEEAPRLQGEAARRIGAEVATMLEAQVVVPALKSGA
jgi:hypothetical protein